MTKRFQSRRDAIAIVVLGLLCQLGAHAAWTVRSDYTPSGPPAAPSPAPGDIGGEWIDLSGNVWGISTTNSIYAVGTGGGAGAAWIRGLLVLPSSYNPGDYNTGLRTYFNAVNNQNYWETFRVSNVGNGSAQTGVMVGFNAGSMACYTYVGVSLAPCSSSSGSHQPSLVGGTNYYLDTIVEQTNRTTTTITARIIRTSDLAQMGDAFVWTTTVSALQNLVGRMGIFYSNSSSPAAYGAPGPYTRLVYLDDLASPALTVWPGSRWVLHGAAVSLTATCSNCIGRLTAATTAGALSTKTPASGIPFMLTCPSSGPTAVTVTVKDATDSLTESATVNCAPGPMQIYADNTDLYFPKAVWKLSGSGASATRETAMPGAYIKASFTGTRMLSLTVDGTRNGGLSGALPVIEWSIDGGPFNVAPIANTTTAGRYQMHLAMGLDSSATHTLKLVVRALDLAAGRWYKGAARLRIAGLQVDAGGSLLPVTPLNCTVLGLGDSITEGVGVDALFTTWADLLPNNAYGSWLPLTANALGCEYYQMGTGGQGMVTANQNANSAPNTWAVYDSDGTPRDFSTPPDYIFLDYGTNDSVSITSPLTGMLASLRTAFPSAKIFAFVPISGVHASEIAAAVAARTSAGDTDVFAISIPDLVPGAPNLGAPSMLAHDGGHPSQLGQAYLAAARIQRVQAALGGSASKRAQRQGLQ